MSAVPFQRHSLTSLQAALEFAPHKQSLEDKVLAFIKESGPHGATDDEIIAHFDTQSVRPRRIALEAAGSVRDALKQRKTRAGRFATVWVIA